MMTREGHIDYFQIQWILPNFILRLKTMYEARGQDNIASASIQTYDVIETPKLNIVNEKRNLSCVIKEILVDH